MMILGLHGARRIALSPLALPLLALGCSFGTSASLQAESILNFPRVSLDAGTVTGLAIVNPGSNRANVTLSLYGMDGHLIDAPGVTNPVNVSIQPGSQFSDVAASVFGSTQNARIAWVQASSESDDLTGFFLYLNSQVSFLDGADLPRLSHELVFNGVEIGGTATTELNLINPGSSPAQVTLRLIRSEDSTTRVINLPPRGVIRMQAGELFPGALSDGAQEDPVYEWSLLDEHFIAEITAVSNAAHPMFSEDFGFGSVTIRVFRGVQQVFEETVALPGTPDPDASVFAGVIGDRVELQFNDHESPECGGFAELIVTGNPL